jgi:two-component system response regulator YesN
LLRILIIDDEPWIIDGLKKAVIWENEGFTIVGEALDAIEGMEKIKALKPDVVIVDIRMPEVSGLEMIRRIREAGSQIEFIIISGYDEFSYAKEGISLGIYEYILKPIHIEELVKILRRLKSRLVSKRKNLYQSNLEIIEQLAQGGNDEKSIICLLDKLGINQVKNLKRVAFARILDQEIPSRYFETQGSCITFIPVGTSNYFLAINYNEMDESALCGTLMHKIKGLEVIGISREIEHLAKINISIREAETATSNEFIFSTPNVFLYRKPEYISAMDVVKEIINGMNDNDYSYINLSFCNVKEFLNKHQWGIEELCFIYNNILPHLINDSDMEATENTNFLTPETIVHEFKCFQEFERFFNIALENSSENKVINNSIKFNKIVREIISYIDDHFSNEIRLADIAESFFINPNYLSVLFKKTTCKTFSQYLTDVRMRKACELLSRTELTIEEVSCRVGYTDYYSFIKAFKRVHDITPGKYRKELTKIV